MSSIIQFLVDEGVFDQDPDGLLWLSAKMQDVISELEQNEKLLEFLEEIEDSTERTRKRWSILYLNFIGAADERNIAIAVEALATWERAARSTRLTEWLMKLRIT